MNQQLIDDLKALGPVLLDEPLSRHTTFGIGGPADAYFVAREEDQLIGALKAAHRHGEPSFILGSGSNVLVLDGGIRGLVIENSTDRVEGPMQNGAGLKVRVASGVSFAALSRRLSFAGYGGLEWACGIPGTLGGAAVFNAGAYGKSLLDELKGIRTLSPRDEIVELKPEQLALTYRTSAFLQGELKGHVVLSVDLSVQKGDADALRARVREFDAQRLAAQPRGRNAGSMFKNPPEHPAWWLVDQVGLRGYRVGNAQISEQHTNFFLNLGGARAADVLAMMELARQRVRERFGIELENEVYTVGES
jgi:UDP-N-acetylmuramate dehydrogenase